MISKLISQAANGKEASSQTLEGNSSEGATSSKKVFQSLLQSLQSKASTDEKKSLLKVPLTAEDTKAGQNKSAVLNILGGKFTTVSADQNSEKVSKLTKPGPILTAPGTQHTEVIEEEGDSEEVTSQELKNTEKGEKGTQSANEKTSATPKQLNNNTSNPEEIINKQQEAEEGTADKTTRKVVTTAENNEQKNNITNSASNRFQQLGSEKPVPTEKTKVELKAGENSKNIPITEKPLESGSSTKGAVDKGNQGKAKNYSVGNVKASSTPQPQKQVDESPKSSVTESVQSKEAVESKKTSRPTITESADKHTTKVEVQKDVKNTLDKGLTAQKETGSEQTSKASQAATGTTGKAEGSKVVEPSTVNHQNVDQGDRKITNPKNVLDRQDAKMTKKEIAADNESPDKTGAEKAILSDKEQNSKVTKKGSPFLRQEQDPQKTKKEKVVSKQHEKQVADANSKDNKVQLTEKQRKLINNFFQKNTAGGISEKGFEMKSMQVEKQVKKEKGSDSKNAKRERLPDPGSAMRMGMGRMGASAEAVPASSTGEHSNVSPTDTSISFDNQQIMWEQESSNPADKKEDKEGNKKVFNNATMRLNQMPIANVSLRKNMLSGLTKSVLKAASEAKKTPEQWQKHNFVLDDGKKVQLSVRESKGVLQVKMGSVNTELSKLLQQNLQHIRDHLKQEFGTDIDLQLENNEHENSSGFSGDSSSSNSKEGYKNNFLNNELTSEKAEQVTLNSVRNFGYNKMEWTA
ncbi:hypothetical protein [Fodinibius saliphilus]|uniref:hypothetical protein n=1 Tax=Fodinibius saliphilus TaxID=1920650 RepID=UPI001108BF24|nr:hypothetical protein [Fodinibius saliphilus]